MRQSNTIRAFLWHPIVSQLSPVCHNVFSLVNALLLMYLLEDSLDGCTICLLLITVLQVQCTFLHIAGFERLWLQHQSNDQAEKNLIYLRNRRFHEFKFTFVAEKRYFSFVTIFQKKYSCASIAHHMVRHSRCRSRDLYYTLYQSGHPQPYMQV